MSTASLHYAMQQNSPKHPQHFSNLNMHFNLLQNPGVLLNNNRFTQDDLADNLESCVEDYEDNGQDQKISLGAHFSEANKGLQSSNLSGGDKSENEIIPTCCFIHSPTRRVQYIPNISSSQKLQSTHSMVASVIKENRNVNSNYKSFSCNHFYNYLEGRNIPIKPKHNTSLANEVCGICSECQGMADVAALSDLNSYLRDKAVQKCCFVGRVAAPLNDDTIEIGTQMMEVEVSDSDSDPEEVSDNNKDVIIESSIPSQNENLELEQEIQTLNTRKFDNAGTQYVQNEASNDDPHISEVVCDVDRTKDLSLDVDENVGNACAVHEKNNGRIPISCMKLVIKNGIDRVYSKANSKSSLTVLNSERSIENSGTIHSKIQTQQNIDNCTRQIDMSSVEITGNKKPIDAHRYFKKSPEHPKDARETKKPIYSGSKNETHNFSTSSIGFVRRSNSAGQTNQTEENTRINGEKSNDKNDNHVNFEDCDIVVSTEGKIDKKKVLEPTKEISKKRLNENNAHIKSERSNSVLYNTDPSWDQENGKCHVTDYPMELHIYTEEDCEKQDDTELEISEPRLEMSTDIASHSQGKRAMTRKKISGTIDRDHSSKKTTAQQSNMFRLGLSHEIDEIETAVESVRPEEITDDSEEVIEDIIEATVASDTESSLKIADDTDHSDKMEHVIRLGLEELQSDEEDGSQLCVSNSQCSPCKCREISFSQIEYSDEKQMTSSEFEEVKPANATPRRRKKRKSTARARNMAKKDGSSSAKGRTQVSKKTNSATSSGAISKKSEGGTASSRASSAESKKLPPIKAPVGYALPPKVKNVKSKIGSLDNIKHKPKGGEKKVESVKLEWNIQSKVGSLENATHKPGGGDKKIMSQKLEFKEKVQSKVGSRDNIKHKPGGGAIKVETQKLDFKEKASSRVGSLDNVKHKPGGGNVKIENMPYKERTSSKGNSVSGSEKGSAPVSPSQSPVPPDSLSNASIPPKTNEPITEENDGHQDQTHADNNPECS